MASLSKADWYNPPPFWQNGPTPGGYYSFPYNNPTPKEGGVQHLHTPVTTGTSVVGICFKNGIAIAADVLGSYGSLARYRSLERVMKVNDNIMLAAGGDYADFQYLKNIIDQKILEEHCVDDGFTLKPKSLHCWLTRVMYNRRSKFDPLWNNFLIAGFDDDKPFLGTVDHLGVAFSDPVIATGYGGYLASPLLRDAHEKNKDMSEEEAVQLLNKAMQILFYRDARSFPKYHLGIITKEKGIEIKGPLTIESDWGAALIGKSS
ncbi:proteasome subunit beta type-4 [Leptopilina heterotoma]|uniref:proteasome subunit beta type-4 n=1 Tax=Leptopilina heterotoma TaxID=63436 RepID=UPI001CA8228F|nr:proteasome subunit beta type-4 [Leptopilina heterotoma]